MGLTVTLTVTVTEEILHGSDNFPDTIKKLQKCDSYIGMKTLSVSGGRETVTVSQRN